MNAAGDAGPATPCDPSQPTISHNGRRQVRRVLEIGTRRMILRPEEVTILRVALEDAIAQPEAVASRMSDTAPFSPVQVRAIGKTLLHALLKGEWRDPPFIVGWRRQQERKPSDVKTATDYLGRADSAKKDRAQETRPAEEAPKAAP